MRVFFIWFFGLIACGFMGGMIGSRLDPYGVGLFGGLIAGMAAFACLRLWLSPRTTN